MGDESIWKKEAAERPVRAERGPGEGASGEPGGSPASEHPVEPEADTKESLWKREVNAETTAEQEVSETEDAPKETLWKREVNAESPPPEPEASETDEPAPEETLWKREISFATAA